MNILLNTNIYIECFVIFITCYPIYFINIEMLIFHNKTKTDLSFIIFSVHSKK